MEQISLAVSCKTRTEMFSMLASQRRFWVRRRLLPYVLSYYSTAFFICQSSLQISSTVNHMGNDSLTVPHSS